MSNTIYIFIFWRNMNTNLTDHNFGLCLHFQQNLDSFFLCNCALVNKQCVNKCAPQNAACDTMRYATVMQCG